MAKYWYSYKNTAPNTPAARVMTANWDFISVLYPGNSFCPNSTARPCLAFAYAGTSSSAHPSSPITAQISTNLQLYLGATIGSNKRYPIAPGGKSYLYNKS